MLTHYQLKILEEAFHWDFNKNDKKCICSQKWISKGHVQHDNNFVRALMRNLFSVAIVWTRLFEPLYISVFTIISDPNKKDIADFR